jgi:signal transduction histidine kinase
VTGGYDQLESLANSFAAVGLDLKCSIDPCPAGLDAEVGTAVYRIAQEALTNANRHGPGSVELTVTAQAAHVLVEASNPLGSDSASTDATKDERFGFGLVGMRERCASVDGSLEVFVHEGMFVVRATLPISPGRVSA